VGVVAASRRVQSAAEEFGRGLATDRPARRGTTEDEAACQSLLTRGNGTTGHGRVPAGMEQTVLKTASGAILTWVRIPRPPPSRCPGQRGRRMSGRRSGLVATRQISWPLTVRGRIGGSAVDLLIRSLGDAVQEGSRISGTHARRRGSSRLIHPGRYSMLSALMSALRLRSCRRAPCCQMQRRTRGSTDTGHLAPEVSVSSSRSSQLRPGSRTARPAVVDWIAPPYQETGRGATRDRVPASPSGTPGFALVSFAAEPPPDAIRRR
jgi:hypothetical protein